MKLLKLNRKTTDTINMQLATFKIDEVWSAKVVDEDCDGGYYEYYDEFDTNFVEEITVLDTEDDDQVISDILFLLEKDGSLAKDKYYIEGDVLQFTIYENDHQPLYRVTLQ